MIIRVTVINVVQKWEEKKNSLVAFGLREGHSLFMVSKV